ncbi:hypothetical protein SAMN06296386_103145 [Lachnospiraceae bacterium]|nr:hypothetical protein SAMN06296386_103145 [Lachnospiraceae bacterium]
MKKADWLIPAAAVMTAVLWYAFLFINSTDGSEVRVLVDGKEYAVYSLESEVDTVIPGVHGMNNHLVIHDGYADITEAGCPDALCVHQKAISKKGETIVCLPNKVVIEITGGEKGEYDAVAN